MKLNIASLALVAFAANGALAIFGGSAGKLAYNKWHETELERWLSDHDVPYPTPADRKDLEDLMKKHWDEKVATPYSSWNTQQLSSYLSSKGAEVKKGTEKNKDTLLSQVKGLWYETSDKANEAYGSVEGWIFDTWTESQLKSFLDYHGIPNPTPRTRDSLLQTARSNYQSVANKAGETFSYPGDWLYSQWSDSDLKAWADERGIPVPQPGNRDKLIATMRRNARTAGQAASDKLASASKSASSASASLSDQLLNSWSDSQLKDWFDKNGIKVPQGSKRNELIALARKNSARLSGDNASYKASSAYGAATSNAGNYYAQATDNAYSGYKYYYDYVMNQLGLASKEASASLSSASKWASSSLSSASSVASASLSSGSSVAPSSFSSGSSVASSEASKSAKSASSEASKSAKSASKSGASAATAATDAAGEYASTAKHRVQEAYQQATDKVKEEL